MPHRQVGSEDVTREGVLGNLMRIRQHGGLSVANVDKHGEQIRKLPCVDAEMRLRTGADRTDAAINVIRCATSNMIKDDVHFSILRSTLLEVDRERTVSDRERYAHVALNSLSGNSIEKHRTRAYTELASILVRISGTPCQYGEIDEVMELIQRRKRLRREAEKVDEQLVRHLIGIGFRSQPTTRIEAAEGLLERCPVGASKVGETMPVVDRALTLILAAATSRGLMTRTGSAISPMSTTALNLFFTGMPSLLERPNFANRSETRTPGRYRRIELRNPTYVADLEIGIVAISHAMQEEESQGWPSLDGPQRDSSIPEPAR